MSVWAEICDPARETVPGIHFGRERFSSVYEEVLPLLNAHYEEIAFYRDIPLSPNTPLYEQADAQGRLRIYTVRDDGNLVGYGVFTVHPAPHYSSSLQAVADIFFLHPVIRGRMVGIRFLKWCDSQLQEEGVQVVSHHVKVKHPTLGKILEKLGYDAQDTIYTRRLD